MTTTTLLADPVLTALQTDHSGVALHHGEAYSYPPRLGPFAALLHDRPQAWADLAHLVDAALIERTASFEPAGWVLHGPVELMTMFAGPASSARAPRVGAVRPLDSANGPEMEQLLNLCDIHTFAPGSEAIAEYLGYFLDGQLVAMAGLRFSLPGWREIGCVATHPDFRARGYARMLVGALMDHASLVGKSSFLFVEAANPALELYRRLGFVEARTRTADYLTRAA